jgi:long-chain acyl-CoA synthetase
MNKIVPRRLLHDGLKVAAQQHADKVAIIADGEQYSYTRLYEAARSLSNSMRVNGFRRGDRCVIYMDNTWPAVVSIYATLLAGGVFVVVNPQTKKDKLKFILDDCSASLLLTDTHLAGNYEPLIGEIQSLLCVIASGDPERIDPSVVLRFDDQLQQAESGVREPCIANDLAALIYTSGSEGNPKGVMHTHQTMMFALDSLIEYLRLSHDERILVVLPLAFDYGLYQLLMSVQLGATLVLEKSFAYPAQIFKVMEASDVTVFPGVPTVFSMLLTMHKRGKLVFPSVTRVTNTAAAMPPEYIKQLRDIFPSALIYLMYGQTECKRVCYLEPEQIDQKPSSVGKAIPGTEVYVLDENGRPVRPGETGILYVRGPHVMKGYWNQPELTAQVLVDADLPGEKKLNTRDWFSMDEDGDLYFQGRSDDIIKSRGEKVSPVEVENVVHGIEGVLETAVIGVSDDVLGEAIKCFVVLDKATDLTLLEIKKACSELLENYMIPKHFEIVDSLPKTATGKISKKELK